MRLQRRAAFGWAVVSVLSACTGRDLVRIAPAPGAGDASSPVDDVDASMPARDTALDPVDARDADATVDPVDARDADADSASELPEASSPCAALSSTSCPFVSCPDPASTVAAASGRCGGPPFIRDVTQASACGRTIVAYRYGASDTTIAFFDTSTGELMGWWNKSDTAEIECVGNVDLACANTTEQSLPNEDNCPPDAG